MEKTLREIPLGKAATVRSVDLDEAMQTRLGELGLVPGCPVRCLYAAASGDPRAYLVRGTVLAIRNCDASRIEVTVWD